MAIKVSVGQIYRAKKAKDEKKTISVGRKPKMLGKEKKKKLVETIDERKEKKEYLKYKKIRTKIYYNIISFLIFFQYFLSHTIN